MSQPKKLKVPVRLIILDGIGAILLGLGIAEQFANTNLIPISWQFTNYAMFMIIFGIAMMLPMVTYILSRTNNSRPREF